MKKEEEGEVLGKLVIALQKLSEIEDFDDLMPEVRINLAYSISNPHNSTDIAAIPGRITAVNGRAFFASPPKFGASDHMARNILEYIKYNDKIRAGLNFKYTEELVGWLKGFCEREGLNLSIVDRNKEPKEVSEVDGSSIPWKIKEAVRLVSNKVPEIIVEGPAMGKEPLILLTGEDPIKVVDLLIKIYDAWKIYKKGR
jgi:hydroxymethylpyrimidine/phosphomethylpyrimidine kinase